MSCELSIRVQECFIVLDSKFETELLRLSYFQVKPMGNFENPNLDSSSVKLYSKNGHSAVIQPSDLEGRTEIKTSQQGACLNVEGKAGTSPGNDALVVEVCIRKFIF